MHAAEARARFLRDRVLTATPAQRVVMLYDRLLRDLGQGDDLALGHAMQIVAELQASLDVTAGGPAENLSSLYGYLLRELIAARGGQTDRLPAITRIVTDLRQSWAHAAEQAADPAPGPSPSAAGLRWAAVG